MGFQETLSKHYPGALSEAAYFDRSYEVLAELGFESGNSIACAGVCRDEITRPFLDHVHRVWGEAFNFSSLAGMLLLGRTGFSAAIHHAPTTAGIKRYVFFAMPHIAIGADGEIGHFIRPGQTEAVGACGALLAFQKELEGRYVHLELDPDDLEQSLLKQRLFRRIPYGDVPDLVRLTQIMHETILEDLERGISLTVDPSHCAYAVMTGIQIHGPEDEDWIWPSVSYAEVYAVKTTFQVTLEGA